MKYRNPTFGGVAVRPLAHARGYWAIGLVLASAVAACTLRALPGPGDVFREYTWSNQGKWQRITAPVTLEKFSGMPNTRLFVAHDVPPHWQTRAGRRHACKITLPDDLAGLQEARLILATWSGEHADVIAINDTLLVRNIGHMHDLSYDEITVPISALKPGVNEFSTKSATVHHGIEVLWPGVVLLARFLPPNAER